MLAGGPQANFVLIPTAAEPRTIDAGRLAQRFREDFNVYNVTVLHTDSRAEADSEAFVQPLLKADGVWISGGRQWRLADAYLGTRTERAIHDAYRRGGVIGGTSAGATIQGSYLVRGAPEGNQIMMAKGHEQGFGLLPNTAIDQHLIKRHRVDDLVPVIEQHPGLLGIGIDENTAVVVRGNNLQVIGESKAAIYDGRDHDGRKYFFVNSGDRFSLPIRARAAQK